MIKQQWRDNGDLNSDPFYLTLEEAKKFANYFEDEQLKAESRDAVKGKLWCRFPNSILRFGRSSSS